MRARTNPPPPFPFAMRALLPCDFDCLCEEKKNKEKISSWKRERKKKRILVIYISVVLPSIYPLVKFRKDADRVTPSTIVLVQQLLMKSPWQGFYREAYFVYIVQTGLRSGLLDQSTFLKIIILYLFCFPPRTLTISTWAANVSQFVLYTLLPIQKENAPAKMKQEEGEEEEKESLCC